MSVIVLPNEILISIIPYLLNPELKACRLCNRLLSKETERHLFKKITVLYLRNDIQRLKAIARSDRLRRCVQRIVYVGDRFISGLTMEQWRHHYSKDRHAQMNSMVWLRHPYREYQKISDDQKKLDDEEASYDLWTTALCAFTDLREIHLLMREYQKPNNGLLQNVVRRTFCEPNGDMIEVTRHAGVTCGNAGLSHLRSMLQPRSSSQSPLSSSSDPSTSAPLRTLHFENVHRCVLGQMELQQAEFPSICFFLERLHVSFAWDEYDSVDISPVSTWWFGSLLSAAPNLRQLQISYEPNLAFFLPLADVLPEGGTMAKLEVIELSHVSFGIQELASVVASHRDKLRKFRIEGADIFGTDGWQLLMMLLGIVLAPDLLFGGVQQSRGEIVAREDLTCAQEPLGTALKQFTAAFKEAAVSYDETQQVFMATWS